MKKVLTEPKVRSYLDQLANHGGTLPILAMAIKAAAPQVSPSDAKVSTLSRALRFALAGTPYASGPRERRRPARARAPIEQAGRHAP